MLAAEPAVLVHFKSVRIVFLILDRVVVSLLALCTSHCNPYSHPEHPYAKHIFGIKKKLAKQYKE